MPTCNFWHSPLIRTFLILAPINNKPRLRRVCFEVTNRFGPGVCNVQRQSSVCRLTLYVIVLSAVKSPRGLDRAFLVGVSRPPSGSPPPWIRVSLQTIKEAIYCVVAAAAVWPPRLGELASELGFCDYYDKVVVGQKRGRRWCLITVIGLFAVQG